MEVSSHVSELQTTKDLCVNDEYLQRKLLVHIAICTQRNLKNHQDHARSYDVFYFLSKKQAHTHRTCLHMSFIIKSVSYVMICLTNSVNLCEEVQEHEEIKHWQMCNILSHQLFVCLFCFVKFCLLLLLLFYFL